MTSLPQINVMCQKLNAGHHKCTTLNKKKDVFHKNNSICP